MLQVLRYCTLSLAECSGHSASDNVRCLRTWSTCDVLILSGIIQIHVFMSIAEKSGTFKVLWVPRYCLFCTQVCKSLCNCMYMQQVGPLCKRSGSVPGSLRSLGAPIGPLRCPRTPARSRTVTLGLMLPDSRLIKGQGEYASELTQYSATPDITTCL